jgi:uncharacterized protein YuzE
MACRSSEFDDKLLMALYSRLEPYLVEGMIMPASRQYDTVAFDVRDNATMLFFAQTTAAGDIEDYLLLMRSENEELDGAIFLEINEKQFAGSEMISEARIFHAPVTELENITELALIFDDTAENRTSMEAGAFRVLGEKLSGGNA